MVRFLSVVYFCVIVIMSIVIFSVVTDSDTGNAVKNRITNSVKEEFSIELADEKYKNLCEQYVELNKRIMVLDSKMKNYSLKIKNIKEKYKKEISENNAKVINTLDTYTRIFDNLKNAKKKLVDVSKKIKTEIDNYEYNREILKSKKVLLKSLKETNKYLKDINIDNIDISIDSISESLDEDIIEEEAALKAYEKIDKNDEELIL